MSLRKEQCKKVCRILDDVLANRPTERDSLIVAVQLAFEALSEPHWIPVTDERMSDLISREQAIDVATSATMEWDGMYVQDLNGRIREAIEQLQPIQPVNNSEVPNSSDCISRQAAIDVCRAPHMRNADCSDFEMEIMMLPSAQPEIIRCRECKFASGDSRICMKFDHSPIGELDFCSFAERREVTT